MIAKNPSRWSFWKPHGTSQMVLLDGNRIQILVLPLPPPENYRRTGWKIHLEWRCLSVFLHFSAPGAMSYGSISIGGETTFFFELWRGWFWHPLVVVLQHPKNQAINLWRCYTSRRSTFWGVWRLIPCGLRIKSVCSKWRLNTWHVFLEVNQHEVASYKCRANVADICGYIFCPPPPPKQK